MNSASDTFVKEIMEQDRLLPKKLGVITATIFLAGEMAGSGVLAIPAALKGTGWSGLLLIAFFSINAAYIGSRLGLCWEVLAESGFEELRQEHVRDPYPLIAEKAGSIISPFTAKMFRWIASGYILATLYGGACVFLILIADFLHDLTQEKVSTCLFMVIAAAATCPLTWFGSPKDFW